MGYEIVIKRAIGLQVTTRGQVVKHGSQGYCWLKDNDKDNGL